MRHHLLVVTKILNLADVIDGFPDLHVESLLDIAHDV
jgi:hypothetical protein